MIPICWYTIPNPITPPPLYEVRLTGFTGLGTALSIGDWQTAIGELAELLLWDPNVI